MREPLISPKVCLYGESLVYDSSGILDGIMDRVRFLECEREEFRKILEDLLEEFWLYSEDSIEEFNQRKIVRKTNKVLSGGMC